MKISITTLGLLFSLTVFAQSKDYIVKHNGDTVRGELKILTKQVSVIRMTGDTILLPSEEVRLFVKDKTQKIVLRLTLYGYSDNIDDVQSTSYSNPVYDTTILLTPLITGEKLNLFTGKDKRKMVYFFVQRKEDPQPVQLLYSVGGSMPDRELWNRRYEYVSYITHHRIFEDQLNQLTSDCDQIRGGDLEMLDYRESSFKKFIKRYNKYCGYNSFSK